MTPDDVQTPAPTAADPRLSALERLAISREHIRVSLQEAANPRPEGDGKPSMLMSALMSIPGAHIVSDALHHWWSQHPMHLAGTLAASTARSVMGPLARRKPFALVLGAMAVGGMLVWLKPWRGIVRPALLAGLVPQIVSRAIAHVPIESWITTLLTMVTLRSASREGEGDGAPTPSPAPAPQAQTASPAQPASPAGDRPTTLH